jgi:hypothetical protein
MHRRWATLFLASMAVAGCDEKPATNLAPSATALVDAKPKPKGAMELSVVPSSGKVSFEMDAPQEKIRGRVEKSITGDIAIDPSDLTATTAHLFVDISGLELFQRKAGDDGEFGEETKNDLQNEHAQAWLEIGSCESDKIKDKPKCEKMTKANRKVEFAITKVETDQKDLSKMTGAERKVTATITGKFLLHQHESVKTAKVELIFKMKDEGIESLQVKTVEPFAVGLAEHDVRPREAFGVFAQKTLDLLAPKVAKDALVSLDFEAKPSGTKGSTEAKPSDAKPAEDTKPADAPAPANEGTY